MEFLERRKMDFNSFVSGFTEGEGCFCVSFNQRSKLKTNIEVRPSFSISQNKKNLELIKKIHQNFQCGSIRFSKSDQNYKFEVRSISDLVKKIIPFFQKYPLVGTKKSDFEKFSQVCDLVYKNQHRNREKLLEIIEISYQINCGKRKYKQDELLKHMTS
jgi:hypothetical protein